jgi:hypothetical protein
MSLFCFRRGLDVDEQHVECGDVEQQFPPNAVPAE